MRDGAKVTIISHPRQIRRNQAVANLAEDLVIDMIDEKVIRAGMNAHAIVSNLPGSPERQRSLFVEGEQCERTPKLYHGDPYENRTRAFAVRGRRPDR